MSDISKTAETRLTFFYWWHFMTFY